ncbi:MAG TPA: DUF418 domain-containing protein [Chitinophagaceae bacterium]|nr:DUF418 domain-containing protein [Chitinophagaceae bacterium]
MSNSNQPQPGTPGEENKSGSNKPARSAAPVSNAERIRTLDVVRGVALLGILLMNIPGFGLDQSAYGDILRGDHQNRDYKTFAIVTTLFEGTMRGLFSMLFGAGMVLFMLNKKDVPGGASVGEYYYRRLLWLLLFGMLNAYILLWPGDILYFYALAGMLLFPFRKWQPRWLVALAVLCIAIGFIKGQWQWSELRGKREAYHLAKAAEKEKKTLTENQQGAVAQWEKIEKQQQPDTARTNRNLRKMHGGYATVFLHMVPENSNNEIWGIYHWVWDPLCMMFLGMALFGLGFFSNKLPTSVYTLTLLLGYGVGVPLGWFYFSQAYGGAFTDFSAFVDRWRVPPFAVYDLKRVFLSLGHASLVMLIYRSRIVPWLMKALACVGQMAFTNYLMQSIFCAFIFYGYGFDYYHRLRYHQLYYIVGAIWLFQLVASVIWLRFFRFGPFEWLWRSLTYWRRQPFKK